MDRDEIQRQERIDITIEGLVRKIDSIIILFKESYDKLEGVEVEIAIQQLKKWLEKLKDIESTYENGYKKFETDIKSGKITPSMRACETNVLTALGTTIKDLNIFIKDLKVLIVDASQGNKIVNDYNALISAYNQYITDNHKLVDTVEKVKILEFRELSLN
jgi:hypothetical protein